MVDYLGFIISFTGKEKRMQKTLANRSKEAHLQGLLKKYHAEKLDEPTTTCLLVNKGAQLPPMAV